MSTVATAGSADDPNQTSKKCTVDLLRRMMKMSDDAESPKFSNSINFKWALCL